MTFGPYCFLFAVLFRGRKGGIGIFEQNTGPDSVLLMKTFHYVKKLGKNEEKCLQYRDTHAIIFGHS